MQGHVTSRHAMPRRTAPRRATPYGMAWQDRTQHDKTWHEVKWCDVTHYSLMRCDAKHPLTSVSIFGCVLPPARQELSDLAHHHCGSNPRDHTPSYRQKKCAFLGPDPGKSNVLMRISGRAIRSLWEHSPPPVQNNKSARVEPPKVPMLTRIGCAHSIEP